VVIDVQVNTDLRIHSGPGCVWNDHDRPLIFTSPYVTQEIPEAIRESPKEPIRNYRLFCGFEKIITNGMKGSAMELENLARVVAGIQVVGSEYRDTREMLANEDLGLDALMRACQLTGWEMGESTLSLGLVRDVARNSIIPDWDHENGMWL